jgi:hypothetical protein
MVDVERRVDGIDGLMDFVCENVVANQRKPQHLSCNQAWTASFAALGSLIVSRRETERLMAMRGGYRSGESAVGGGKHPQLSSSQASLSRDFSTFGNKQQAS